MTRHLATTSRPTFGFLRRSPVEDTPAAPTESLTMLGPTTEDVLEIPPQSAAHRLGQEFLRIAENGFIEDYAKILALDVVYLVPGRSTSAGLHQGSERVIAALCPPAASGVQVTGCEATELVTAGDRAVAIIQLEVTLGTESYAIEVVFHLRCHNDEIVAITEYSSDQYLADGLIEAPEPQEPTPPQKLLWRRRR